MPVALQNLTLKEAVDFAYVQHLENSKLIHSLLCVVR